VRVFWFMELVFVLQSWCSFEVTIIKIHGSCDFDLAMALRGELEKWTHREWRQRRHERNQNHIVVLTIDHCLTRFLIRSFRAFWHDSQAKCSDSGSKADSNVLVDKSGLASHAR